LDALRLNKMTFFAFHGVKPFEKTEGGVYEVDVELSGDLSRPCRTDDLKDTWDIEQLYRLVQKVVTEMRFNLIEALAEEICYNLLRRFPASQARVKVRKIKPPLPGVVDCSEIEIVRNASLLAKRGASEIV